MPWRVPLVGGSYMGSASKTPPPPPPPPPNPPSPALPFLPFFAKPSFLLSCPGAGPAAEAARASVYN